MYLPNNFKNSQKYNNLPIDIWIPENINRNVKRTGSRGISSSKNERPNLAINLRDWIEFAIRQGWINIPNLNSVASKVITINPADPFNPNIDCNLYNPGDLLVFGGVAPTYDFIWSVMLDDLGNCKIINIKSPSAATLSPDA